MTKAIFTTIALLFFLTSAVGAEIATDIADDSKSVSNSPQGSLSNIFSEVIIKNWSGVCLTALYGKADIKSSVDISGHNREVANGSADYTGYSLTFENSKNVKGFSWLLYPRFINQKISIADFREDIRYVDVADTQNIDYIVTDYETGVLVDPLDVNRYQIEIDSVGLMLKGMYQWNSEEKYSLYKSYFNVYCGIGAAELFDIGIELGEDNPKKKKWYFGSSYSAGISGGLLINAINTLVEIKYQFTDYPKLILPGDAEFRYKYIYNEEKEVYERARLFLDEVDFAKSTVCLSATYFFN